MSSSANWAKKHLDTGEAENTIKKQLDELEGDKKKGDSDGKYRDEIIKADLR